METWLLSKALASSRGGLPTMFSWGSVPGPIFRASSTRYFFITDPFGRKKFSFFFQAEDGIRALYVTGVQTCALPIWLMSNSSEFYGLMHMWRESTFRLPD